VIPRPITVSERTRALLREEAERPLSREEYVRRAAVPISEHEREEIIGLIRWFTRRYPTAGERFAYARRAYARWANKPLSKP